MLASKSKLVINYLRIISTLQLSLMMCYLLRLQLVGSLRELKDKQATISNLLDIMK